MKVKKLSDQDRAVLSIVWWALGALVMLALAIIWIWTASGPWDAVWAIISAFAARSAAWEATDRALKLANYRLDQEVETDEDLA